MDAVRFSANLRYVANTFKAKWEQGGRRAGHSNAPSKRVGRIGVIKMDPGDSIANLLGSSAQAVNSPLTVSLIPVLLVLAMRGVQAQKGRPIRNDYSTSK